VAGFSFARIAEFQVAGQLALDLAPHPWLRALATPPARLPPCGDRSRQGWDGGGEQGQASARPLRAVRIRGRTPCKLRRAMSQYLLRSNLGATLSSMESFEISLGDTAG